MKTYSGQMILAKALSGSGELDTFGKNTVDEVKAYIDESNERRIQEKWISKPEQYIIACKKWERNFDDDGSFVSESSNTERIEIYPSIQD